MSCPQLVFLSGSRSSSVEFVHSLLDSHPQVLAVPFPVMFHYFWRLHGYKKWADADSLFDDICSYSGLAMVLNNYRSENQYMAVDGRSAERLNIDKTVFRKVFKEELKGLPMNRRNTFTAFYHSYAAATGIRWENVRVILENSHHTFFHKEILEDFPEARFISPLRDPRAIFASCRKGRFGKVYEGLSETSILMHLFQTFINQETYTRLLGASRYLLIKNEDIHEDHEGAVRRLAQWLRIDYHETLLQCTFAGSPWQGNSAYRQKLSPDLKQGKNTERWMQELSASELVLAEYLFYDFIQKYGYPVYSSLARSPKPLRWLGYFSFLLPVKNQMSFSETDFASFKNRLTKCLECPFFPLFRLLSFIFYRAVRSRYQMESSLSKIDPNQNIFPKIRILLSAA